MSIDPQNIFALDNTGVHSPAFLVRTAESPLSGQQLVQGHTASDENSRADMEVCSLLPPGSSARPQCWEERNQVKTIRTGCGGEVPFQKPVWQYV